MIEALRYRIMPDEQPSGTFTVPTGVTLAVRGRVIPTQEALLLLEEFFDVRETQEFKDLIARLKEAESKRQENDSNPTA